MKAVTKIIIPLFLSLAGVVLAAPHQSVSKFCIRSISCTADCADQAMSCREVRNCIARVQSSVPPVHETSSFLYW